MTVQYGLVFLLFLVLLSGILSASETSFMLFSNVDLKEEEGNSSSRIYNALRYWIDNPNTILSSVLILNNVANILISSISTSFMHSFLDKGENVVLLSTLIVSTVVIIFGEITPKIIARNYSKSISRTFIVPMIFIARLMYPLTLVLTWISRFISWIFGFKVLEGGIAVTEKDILSLVSVGEEEGSIGVDKKEMIHGIFNFTNSNVGDLCVPRKNVYMLDASLTLKSVWREILDSGFSRVPIYEDSIDNIVGALYIKDLLAVATGSNLDIPIKEHMREITFVPETKDPLSLLKEFRERKTHIAVVVDEYGGTSGIITIEDILEEIVGEINDEYDKEEEEIKKIDSEKWIVKASLHIDDLNEELKLSIPISEDYDTLGGFLYSIMGKVPKMGDSTKWGNLIFTIAEIEGHTIKNVAIKLVRSNDEF